MHSEVDQNDESTADENGEICSLGQRCKLLFFNLKFIVYSPSFAHHF